MLLFLVLPIFLSADSASIMHINWQNKLMGRFFADISTSHLLKLSGNSFSVNGPNDYCNGLWAHISCEDARITRIHYSDLRVRNFRLHELPPTIEFLSIDNCYQTGTFLTRNLPRALVSLSLVQNGLSGRLDLTTLPEDLEIALFWGNRFTGPICLCHLPKRLGYLEVHANEIAQEVVWYDNLPPGIVYIRLQNSSQLKIGRVCALDPGKAVDPKIFPGMLPSAIE